ncbi:MAG: hypothetical protein Tsb0024_10540 [Ruegeria sp.]
MIKLFKKFRKDESGAVTVDWVVLTAAVVGLGTVAYTQISSGATGLATNVNRALDGATVSTGTNAGAPGGITDAGAGGTGGDG